MYEDSSVLEIGIRNWSAIYHWIPPIGFGRSNPEIGRKMTDGRLLFQALEDYGQ